MMIVGLERSRRVALHGFRYYAWLLDLMANTTMYTFSYID